MLPYHLEIIADRLSFHEGIEQGGDDRQYERQILAQSLLSRHPKLGDRVSREMVEEVFSRWPSCLEALRAAATEFLALRNGEAHLQSAPYLRQARSLFEEDLLLAALFADPAPGETEYRPLDAWKLVPNPLPLAIPRDLAEVLERPLAETHLHLAGTAPPITFWLPLMLSLLSIERAAWMLAQGFSEEAEETRHREQVYGLWLRRLVEAAVLRCWIAAVLPEGTGDPGHPFLLVHGLREAEGRPQLPGNPVSLEEWINVFRQTFDRIGHASPGEVRGPALPRCPVWVDPLGRFPYRDCLTQAVEVRLGVERPLETAGLGERYLLASALRLLKVGGGDRLTPLHSELRRHLLRYVRIKHSFFRLLVHTPGIHGLERFRLRLRRGQAKQRYDRARRVRQIWELSAVRSQTRLTVLRWLKASTELPLLKAERPNDQDLQRTEEFLRAGASRLKRRLELRISPGEGPRHGLLIRAVAQGVLEALETLAEPYLPQQALPALQVGLVIHLHKHPRQGPEIYAETFRHVFDWLEEHPAWRSFVVGVDVAGSELDSGPSRFTLAYRRLQKSLEAGVARERRAAIQLGKTFHVGEDFRDLLTGIRQVSLAVDLLHLTAGDRLGHALAIGHEPGSWYHRHHEESFPRLGDHLLDLLWARDLLLQESAPDGGGRALATVEERWTRLGAGALGEATDSFRGWLRELKDPDSAAGLLSEEQFQQRLVQKHVTAPGAGGTASSLTRVQADDSWISLLAQLQDRVIRRLDREGIAVEANPTSNLLISGLSEFAELPLFRLHPIEPPGAGRPPVLRLSVSTDDPEVFRVHLREEYLALLSAGLKKSGHSRRAILDWLDRLRQDGFDTSFLKRSSPRGAELLGYLRSLTQVE